eukprot:CAMPEP_0203659614 /NCGR_PEP_ID=MMETSP0088-20131115/52812_1 /ASSEMBLY_ACC=CAM_ASM_001087 /TAXON_ID=426623 /ORGANISM="Chaetoceros affinis, Strain CCMP159" /LENGTH=38 /DNA_ID= /DNA_START= /DNA_END= /DNA_ORIENTATION=
MNCAFSVSCGSGVFILGRRGLSSLEAAATDRAIEVWFE